MYILIVEDDSAIAQGLTYSLQKEGYETIVCGTVAEALPVVKSAIFSIALLDVMLPDGSGYEICRAIKKDSDIPVIFLTACDEEVNVVMGFDMGADDYVAKPFRLRELLSRIQSVLRRCQNKEDIRQTFDIEQISVNIHAAKVYRQSKEVLLTAMEYRLLLTMIQHAGQILTRNQLLEGIWDIAGSFVNDNTLTVYVKRLREKLEDDPQNPTIIQTVRGLGYRLGD